MKIGTRPWVNSSWQFRKELFAAGLANALSCAEELKVLTDSVDARIPIQYRYLSLFKILELNFGSELGGVSDFLRPYEARYAQMFPPKTSLKAFLLDLRARCAHVRANRGAMGVTALSYEDMTTVERALPFVFEISQEAVNRSPRNSGLRLGLSMFDAYRRQERRESPG